MTAPVTVAVGELLYGLKAIAGFLGTTPRQALYLVEKDRIPFWREGRAIVARRDSLREWARLREASARGAAS